MYVLTWNLFHGRARRAAGRPLLVEFAAAIAGWEWDVALLQEVPPWWPPALAHAAGAQQRSALTSRNSLLPLRAAIGRRNPDLIASNGGGANAILVRGTIHDHREIELTRRPERRAAHAARTDAGWVVNLHASKEPKERTRADVARALEWAPAPLAVFGGDLNLTRPEVPGLDHAAGHHVDHLYAPAGGGPFVARTEPPLLPGRRPPASGLSDHLPLWCDLSGRSPAA